MTSVMIHACPGSFVLLVPLDFTLSWTTLGLAFSSGSEPKPWPRNLLPDTVLPPGDDLELCTVGNVYCEECQEIQLGTMSEVAIMLDFVLCTDCA